MDERAAWGFGLATVTRHGDVLDVWFPQPALGNPPDGVTAPIELATLAGKDKARKVTQAVVLVVADLDAAPADTADAYLRLHLLSHRLVTPNSICLDGIFAVLPNVVWTNHGLARWRVSSRPGPGCVRADR